MQRMDKQLTINGRTYDLQVLPGADGKGLHVTAKEGAKLVHDLHVGSDSADALEGAIDEVIAVIERQLIRGGGQLRGGLSASRPAKSAGDDR
ncbi:MAG: hypothetical protein ABWY00_09815 [Dongiaceae bacterium]